jgi:hypothetical protein
MVRRRVWIWFLTILSGLTVQICLAGCTSAPDQLPTFVEDFTRQLFAAFLF